MTCSVSDKTSLENTIVNKKALNKIRENQQQETTVDFLKTTQDNFEKKDGQYHVKDSNVKLEKTITTEINKDFEKVKVLADDKTLAKWEQMAEVGNLIHDLNEHFGKMVLSELEGKDFNIAFSYLKNMEFDDFDTKGVKKILSDYDYQVGKDVLKNVFEGMRETLLTIYNHQNNINNTSKSRGNVKVFYEQMLIDPKKNLGGTADMIAIYSDNSASVFDFKSKIPFTGNLNPNGSYNTNEWITEGNKKKYRMQLGEISRILQQNYGVSKIVFSRIEYIRANMKYDTKTGLYERKINNLAFGEKQDKFQKPYSPFLENTTFKNLNVFLKAYQDRIDKLRHTVKNDKSKKQSAIDEIKRLEDIKHDILIKYNFDKLFGKINLLLYQSSNDAISTMNVEELQQTLEDLKLYASFMESTNDFKQYLEKHLISKEIIGQKVLADGTVEIEYSKNGSEIVEDLNNKIKDFSVRLDDKIAEVKHQLFNEQVANIIYESTGIKVTDDAGNILPFTDEGYFGKIFNQLSQFENPVFQTLRNKLDDAQYNIREDTQNLIKEVQQKNTNLRKWMKENGKDWKWFIDLIIDKKTGNLVKDLNDDFGKLLKDLEKSLDIEQLISIYKPDEHYQTWFKTESDRIAAIGNGNMYGQFIQDNSLELDSNGKPKYPKVWQRVFLKERWKLDIKQNIKDKYKSENKKIIDSIPETKAFYDMYVSYNKQFREMLGFKGDYAKLPNNFLANIRRSTTERITELGMIEGMKSAMKEALDDLNVREDDMEFGQLKDGRLQRTIPKFYLNPFKDKNTGETLIEEKSFEIDKSLVLFGKMAYNYKYMSQIQAETLAFREFLVEGGEQLVKRNGKTIRDLVGNKLAINLKDTNMIEIFDSFVDAYLYGIKVNPAFGDTNMVWEKRILKAKEYMSAKSLGFSFIPAAGSYFSAKTLSLIEGSKGILYTKDDYLKSNKAAYSERDKFLAIYAYFDPMGHRQGEFSLHNEKKMGEHHIGDPTERTFIGKYVNSRMLLRPFSLGDEHLDECILSAMSHNYYVTEEGDLKRMKNDNEREIYKNRTIWNVFNYKDGKAELVGLSNEEKKNVIKKFRGAVQAAQSKIKGTIPEEDRAYWQSQLVGQVVMHFKSWMPGLMKERFGKIKYNNRTLALEMGKYVAAGQEFKNIDHLAVTEYMTRILAPKMGDFIKHLFGFSKMNDVNMKQMLYEEWLEKNPHYRDKIDFEEWNDIQQRMLRSLMVELRVLLGFATVLFLLARDWDDDGEADFKQYLLTRKLASIMFKTNQELSFCWNPVDFANMVKNPVPMINLFTDAWKTIKNTGDETRDIIFGENSKRDKTGLFYYSHQWIPGLAGGAKLLDIFNDDSGQGYQ